ncbi:hypothetical protein COOONC_27358 [Cooperia oncophora]
MILFVIAVFVSLLDDSASFNQNQESTISTPFVESPPPPTTQSPTTTTEVKEPPHGNDESGTDVKPPHGNDESGSGGSGGTDVGDAWLDDFLKTAVGMNVYEIQTYSSGPPEDRGMAILTAPGPGEFNNKIINSGPKSTERRWSNMMVF